MPMWSYTTKSNSKNLAFTDQDTLITKMPNNTEQANESDEPVTFPGTRDLWPDKRIRDGDMIGADVGQYIQVLAESGIS